MWYLIVKASVSGILIAAASEISRRNPAIGGLIVSLPLVALLAVIWLWLDTQDVGRVAAQSASTFWFVLPTLPMFLVLPLLLKHGAGFWLSLAAVCVMTIMLYSLTFWLLPKAGIDI